MLFCFVHKIILESKLAGSEITTSYILKDFRNAPIIYSLSLPYGSLYVTLCFVLCPFDFGVLSFQYCMLCSLFVYKVAHFKRRNSRSRAKVEKYRGKKDESISILTHPS